MKRFIRIPKLVSFIFLSLFCSVYVDTYASYVQFCASDSDPTCPECYRPRYKIGCIVKKRCYRPCFVHKHYRHHCYHRRIHRCYVPVCAPRRIICIQTLYPDIDLDRRTADDLGSELQIN